MTKKRLLGLLVFATISLVYSASLSNEFVWLDHSEILNKKLIISDLDGFIRMFFLDDNNYAGYHRPMYNLMHSVDHLLWGDVPFGFHLSSLILHVVNALLLMRILIDLTKSRYFAFVVAAVFGLLPCHTATVSLIHSKADLLSAFFILLAISVASRWGMRFSKPLSWQRILLICVLFLAALLSKEVAIMLPVFGLLVAYLFRQKKRNILGPSLGYSMLLVGMLFLLFRISNGSEVVNTDALGFADRLLSFIPEYVNYLFLTLPGFELTTNDAVLIWNHMGVGKYIFYALVFFTSLWIQFKLSKKHIIIACGFVWYNVFLLPVSQIIPILHFRADRFMYIPSMGFLIAVTYLFFHFYEKRHWQKYKVPFAVLFLLYLFISSISIWTRNKDFSSNEVMFAKLVEAHPECREAQGIMANEYLLDGNYDMALIHLEKALAVQEEYYSFLDRESNLGNLGVIYMNQNKTKEALAIFNEIESQETFNPVLLFNIGICLKRLKQFNLAKDYFEKYLIHKPDNIDALFNLGQLAMELDDLEMRKKYFGRYLELNPTSRFRKHLEALLD